MGTVLVVLLVEALAFIAYEAYVFVKHGKLKTLVTELDSKVKGVETSLIKGVDLKVADLLKKIKTLEDKLAKVSAITSTIPTAPATTTVAPTVEKVAVKDPPDAPPPPDSPKG